MTYINCEKVDAIRKAINELEDCGYIHRSRDRNEKGHLTGAIYTIHEEPQVEITEKNDSTDGNPMNAEFSPALDYPTLENPMQLNTNILKVLGLVAGGTVINALKESVEEEAKKNQNKPPKTEEELEAIYAKNQERRDNMIRVSEIIG